LNAHHEGAISKDKLASTVEAIIGAVWFDSNKDFEVVRRVVKDIYGDDLAE
jgi:dsRNA-specific ribonuclease